MILLEKCLERRDVWACFDRGRGFCLLINKEIETCKPVFLKDIKINFEVHTSPLLGGISWWLMGQRGIISTTFTARDKMPIAVSFVHLPLPQLTCRKTGVYPGPKGVPILKDSINFKTTGLLGLFSFLFHVPAISNSPKKRRDRN